MSEERKASKRKISEDSESVQETGGSKSQDTAGSRVVDDSTSFPAQCSDDGPQQSSDTHQPSAEPQQSSQAHADRSTSPTAQAKNEKMKIWKRVLEDPTVQKYLLQCIDAQDILVYFYYMPQAWAERIRATHQNSGRYSGAKELLEHLPKISDDENDWAEDFKMALRESGQDLLVELLEETYTAKEHMPDEMTLCQPDRSMKVGNKDDEDYSKDFGPAAQAFLQHRQLWERTFRENKQNILRFIEPRDILPYLQYLPRDRILAVCDNDGRTRGADELIESMFEHSDRTWMKDFTGALRSRYVNHVLLANLLDSHFRDLLEKTKTDPDYKELHEFYKKAAPCSPDQISTLYYTGPKKIDKNMFC